MTHPASASSLYRVAAGLTPVGTAVVEHPDHCMMCAAALKPGDLANPVTKRTFTDAFNNTLDLRAPSGHHVCGDCQVLWRKDWLQKYSKTFACEQGVFKLASNEHLAGFLFNPPEPPFAAIFSTKQQQHMIWRTPLSLSRDLFVVRVDNDLLTIRQPLLLEALAAYRHAESIMAAVKPMGRTALLKAPAALFDRGLAHGQMGMLRPDVEALLRQVGEAWIIDLLHGLSMGEWWALNAVRHFDPDQPPAWQPAMEAA